MKRTVSIPAIACLLSGVMLLTGFSQVEPLTVQADSLSEKVELALQNNEDIIIEDGVYHDFQLTFTASGTASQPISLKARNPGKVILTGSSFIHITGSHVVLDGFVFQNGYYLKEGSTDAAIMLGNKNGTSVGNRITNVTVDGYNPPNKADDARWARVYGSYNRIDHCTFVNKNTQGLMLEIVRPNNDPNYAQIDHNYFGFFEPGISNGAETIRIGTSDRSQSSSYSVVEDNFFEECNGEIEFISNKAGGNIYRNNTIYNTLGNLTLRHGNSCTVENNVFLNNKGLAVSGGVRVMDRDHMIRGNYFEGMTGTSYRYSGVSLEYGVVDSPLNRYFEVIDTVIENNTFVDNKTSIVNGVDPTAEKSLPPKNTSITNNLFIAKNNDVTVLDTGVDSVYLENIISPSIHNVIVPPALLGSVHPVDYVRTKAGLLFSDEAHKLGVGSSLTTFITRDQVGAPYFAN